MSRDAARSLTVQERRAVRLERWSLGIQLAVAIIGAVISFQALRDAGLRMGLAWAAPLLPLAVDGFAVIASLGIIRSQGAGERPPERASEWLGLCFVLGLSIAGNVAHALDRMDPDFSRILAGLFGAAPPIIVAYGIHVYGRAMTSGVGRHVLVDDPDRIHFGLRHLGEDDTVHPPRGQRGTVQPPRGQRGTVQPPRGQRGTVQPPRGQRGTVQPRERATAGKTVQPPAKRSAQDDAQGPAKASGRRDPRDSERQRAFQVWGQLHTGQPVNAKDVLRGARVSKDESTVRRWCRAWEKEADFNAALQKTSQPIVRRSA